MEAMPLPSVGMLTKNKSAYQLSGFDAAMLIRLSQPFSCECGIYEVALSHAESDSELRVNSQLILLTGKPAELLCDKILYAEGN